MSGSSATKENTLGPGVTVYEGARRFKPGSPESVWPERFKDNKLADLDTKEHTSLRDKMIKGKPVKGKSKKAAEQPPSSAGTGGSA